MATNARGVRAGGARQIALVDNTSAGAQAFSAIAAPASGYRIRVLGVFVSANANLMYEFYSGDPGASGVKICARALYTAAPIESWCESGLMVCDDGVALYAQHSGAARAAGTIVYVVEPVV